MADFCDIQGMKARAEMGLANRWFQPLTHVSSGGFPRYSAICCQRAMREKRGEQRFAMAQWAAQSVAAVFPLKKLGVQEKTDVHSNGE